MNHNEENKIRFGGYNHVPYKSVRKKLRKRVEDEAREV